MGSEGFSLGELADRLGGTVVGDRRRVVLRVRPLDEAGPEDLSFLHNPRYAKQAEVSRAGAVVVADPASLPGRDLLVFDEPYLALARLLGLLHPAHRPRPGIHPSAVVAGDASLGEEVAVGPQAVIGPGSRVGDGTVIGAVCRKLLARIYVILKEQRPYVIR